MKEYIELRPSPFREGYYSIVFDPAECMERFPNKVRCSLQVMIARLLNLSFASYLRYARDVLGADLVGKNSLYVCPFYKKTNDVCSFVKLLNARLNYILNKFEYPYEYEKIGDEIIRTEIEELK